jgi:single-stranded DNA-binding protein
MTQHRAHAQVRVVGRLKTDEWTSAAGEKRSKQVVTASEIAMVTRPQGVYAGAGQDATGGQQGGAGDWQASGAGASAYPQMPPPAGAPNAGSFGGGGADTWQPANGTAPPAGGPSKVQQAEEMWALLVRDQNSFFDNRTNKRSPKGPDFVHKGTRFALWLNSAPAFARDALEQRGSPAA